MFSFFFPTQSVYIFLLSRNLFFALGFLRIPGSHGITGMPGIPDAPGLQRQQGNDGAKGEPGVKGT